MECILKSIDVKEVALWAGFVDKNTLIKYLLNYFQELFGPSTTYRIRIFSSIGVYCVKNGIKTSIRQYPGRLALTQPLILGTASIVPKPLQYQGFKVRPNWGDLLFKANTNTIWLLVLQRCLPKRNRRKLATQAVSWSKGKFFKRSKKLFKSLKKSLTANVL